MVPIKKVLEKKRQGRCHDVHNVVLCPACSVLGSHGFDSDSSSPSSFCDSIIHWVMCPLSLMVRSGPPSLRLSALFHRLYL